MVDRGLYNYPTTCKEPERLSEKMWDVVRSSEFACKVKKKNYFLFFKTEIFLFSPRLRYQKEPFTANRGLM